MHLQGLAHTQPVAAVGTGVIHILKALDVEGNQAAAQYAPEMSTSANITSLLSYFLPSFGWP